MCPAQSARIRCRTSQDDGRRASQTNDRTGGKGCAETASVQAKDPQGAENEGNRGQCDARQAYCEDSYRSVQRGGIGRRGGKDRRAMQRSPFAAFLPDLVAAGRAGKITMRHVLKGEGSAARMTCSRSATAIKVCN